MQRAQGLPQTGRLLSRRYAPGAAAWAVPAQLTAATEVHLPARDGSYYRILIPPPYK